jgi:hypothetical protein
VEVERLVVGIQLAAEVHPPQERIQKILLQQVMLFFLRFPFFTANTRTPFWQSLTTLKLM